MRLRHTDYQLWALFALTALFGFGFVSPDGDPTEELWNRGRIWITGQPAGLASAAPVGFAAWLIVWTAPAALAGWVAQAVATRLGVRLSGRPRTQQTTDYEDP